MESGKTKRLHHDCPASLIKKSFNDNRNRKLHFYFLGEGVDRNQWINSSSLPL